MPGGSWTSFTQRNSCGDALEAFLDMALPMPVLKYQEHGLKVFKALQKTNADRATILQELEPMLPSILDRAFRGEL